MPWEERGQDGAGVAPGQRCSRADAPQVLQELLQQVEETQELLPREGTGPGAAWSCVGAGSRVVERWLALGAAPSAPDPLVEVLGGGVDCGLLRPGTAFAPARHPPARSGLRWRPCRRGTPAATGSECWAPALREGRGDCEPGNHRTLWLGRDLSKQRDPPARSLFFSQPHSGSSLRPPAGAGPALRWSVSFLSWGDQDGPQESPPSCPVPGKRGEPCWAGNCCREGFYWVVLVFN